MVVGDRWCPPSSMALPKNENDSVHRTSVGRDRIGWCIALPCPLETIGEHLEKPGLLSDEKCSGKAHYNVSLTAYFPDFNTGIESDYLDMKGKKLRTLQNFLDGRCDFVTVAMDENLGLNYGSTICVPELNEHFGRKIPLQVRDHGTDLEGQGFSRMDICVRSEEDSYDQSVNRMVTVYN